MFDLYFPKGTVLKVRCSTYWHYGISDGGGGVVHNSKKRRCVQHESLEEFSEGKEVIVSTIVGNNPVQAYSNAVEQLGRPYNLFSQNCEQFVREAHGLPAECTQLQQCVVALAGGYIILSAGSPLLKIAGLGLLIGAAMSPTEYRPYHRAARGATLAVGCALWTSKLFRRLKRL